MLRLIRRMSQTLFCCVCHLPQPGARFPKALDMRPQHLGPGATPPKSPPSSFHINLPQLREKGCK